LIDGHLRLLDQMTPTSILSDKSCKVQSLTVSDQHATLLLTYNKKKRDISDTYQVDSVITSNEDSIKSVVKSLLKLTLVPFHKELLGSNPVYSESGLPKSELNLMKHNEAASAQIRKFLKDYTFELKSESGAEYSHYSASPTVGLQTIPAQIKSTVKSENLEIKQKESSIPIPLKAFGMFNVELISPASERQISRAMPSFGSTLIHETPELYQKVVLPYIQSIVNGGSLGWINNVIEVKKEKERLLVNNLQFLVNIDTKWRSHPPPLSTPREEWYNHPSVEDLYCLGIVKEKGIACLRDLTGAHIDMLKSMQEEGLKAIETIYGVKSDQIRCFVHYQPQFYHFHVHFTRLENEIGSTVEKGHLLVDIIQNLEMDPMYYQKRTITYKLKKLSPLHNLIHSFLNENHSN